MASYDYAPYNRTVIEGGYRMFFGSKNLGVESNDRRNGFNESNSFLSMNSPRSKYVANVNLM